MKVSSVKARARSLASILVLLALPLSLVYTKTALAAPPETTIDSQPIDFSTDTTPTFTFSSDDPAATFECKTELTSYTPCTSPYTLPAQAAGTHTFTVRATNAGLETDASPAYHIWTIVAFGGGNGSSLSPYQISNCSQLEAINNDLAAHYKLTGDVDCDGYVYDPIGDGSNFFTGELNGEKHSIKNITINQTGAPYTGIFANAVTTANIHDLSLVGGHINGQSVVGALVGTVANGATITNIRVSGVDINSTTGITGGIIGSLNDGSVLSNSSYELGTITDTGGIKIGGLVGSISNATVNDSYAKGTINADFAGGLVGHAFNTTTINRSYANVVFSGSHSTIGGLIGNIHANATISNSFSISQIPSSNTSSGAIFGVGTGHSSNNYFDEYLSEISACSSTAGAVCNAVNASNSDPSYFKDNHTNPPLNNWSFGYGSPWHQTHLYPELFPFDDDDGDSALNDDETAGPNSGDANGDSTDDNHQPNVNSTSNWVSGKYMSVASLDCSEITNVQIGDESTSGPSVDALNSYPAGQFSFIAKGCPVGGSAQFNLYFYGDYDISRLSLRKYSSAQSKYITIPGVSFTTLTIGGHNVLKATYSITDGSSLDDGGTVDGVITDPVGLALGAVTAPNTGLPSSTSPVISGLFLLIGTFTVALYAIKKHEVK